MAQDLQWIEFFAGTRMATKCVSDAGYRVASLDIDDAKAYGLNPDSSCFDILSPSGFVLLGPQIDFSP